MKFAEFLIESENGYKTKIDLDKAKKLINDLCKNIDLHKPLWRGMRDDEDAFILHGEKGNRVSITDGNYHNVMIDHNIKINKLNYPLRSKSIICITNRGKSNTDIFGPERYAILPFDNTVIGVVPESDILSVGLGAPDIHTFNAMLNNVFFLHHYYNGKITFKTVSDLVDAIYKVVKDPSLSNAGKTSYENEYFFKTFGELDEEGILDKLESLFDLDKCGFKSIVSKDINYSKSNECWIGGGCIAIHESVYDELIKDLESERENKDNKDKDLAD